MAPLNFGILMVPYQMLDVAGPFDIIHSSTKEALSFFAAAGIPGYAEVLPQALDITFHHISETLEPVAIYGGLKLLPTTTCDTCPPLDFLLVGGPDPFGYKIPERFADFLREHVKAGKQLFTTCTGALAIASSGVLDGKTATANNGVLAAASQVAPKVDWVEKQWVEDGNVWTAGGACAGMDMIAHWVIKNLGMELAKLVFYGLDYEPRDVDGNRVLPQQHGVAKD